MAGLWQDEDMYDGHKDVGELYMLRFEVDDWYRVERDGTGITQISDICRWRICLAHALHALNVDVDWAWKTAPLDDCDLRISHLLLSLIAQQGHRHGTPVYLVLEG